MTHTVLKMSPFAFHKGMNVNDPFRHVLTVTASLGDGERDVNCSHTVG